MSSRARFAAGCALVVLLLLVPSAQAAPCAGGDAAGGSSAARAKAMRCLVSQVRTAMGRPALHGSRALSRSAAAKAAAIARCRSVAHDACGSSLRTSIRRAGYAGTCFKLGENLASAAPGMTPRDVLDEWLASPGHRANLLSTTFRDTGLAARTVELPGGAVEVWVQHFGSHC
jgi:uncharacterized protein YkwD